MCYFYLDIVSNCSQHDLVVFIVNKKNLSKMTSRKLQIDVILPPPQNISISNLLKVKLF
jgi:hypothetical protein